jgi:NADPH-dependent 2,4-dienoyl-CoA reductase/sulfur reductase-like enzyme
VGRINDPYVAADILARGDADLIGLARTLLCDPDFVKKTMEGRAREIRRCTACCYCFDQLTKVIMKGDKEARLKCAINPELGREGEGLIKPATQKKHVVIAGGGPAGLEAARVTALRGHRVTLFEEEDKLGGMINLAIVPPHKEELRNIIDYYTYQMEILHVQVHLGEMFTKDKIKAVKPDAIVLAAGAEALTPDVPGIKGGNVVTALDVLSERVSVSDNVVIIGGGMIGAETAEYLADQRKNVTIVEMLKSVATDIGPSSRWGFLSRLKKKVNILTLTTVIEVKEGAVVVCDKDGNQREIYADSVVLAAGLRSRSDLTGLLEQLGIEYYIIGSCREPGQIVDAVAEAFDIGCKI